MTALLEHPAAVNDTAAADEAFGQRLRQATVAVRLQVRWPSVRKTLKEHQRQQAADAFDADTKLLTAAKKLLDTGHPAFRAVTSVKNQAVSYWRGATLPYVEPGVRLLRRDQIAGCNAELSRLQGELETAVRELDSAYSELVDQARQRLGNLFDSADYPPTLRDAFALSWDFPEVSPPEYLRRIAPEIYQQECQRIQQRFSEAVVLAEQAFAEELREHVTHLAERLSGQVDGRPKVFRDTAVTNLQNFFARFRSLSIGSNAELEQLIEQAQQVVSGVAADDLREPGSLRRQVAEQLTRVEASLEGWLVDRPRRNILRKSS